MDSTREKHLTRPLFAKIRAFTILLLVLASIMVAFFPLAKVKAATSIISIEPSSGNVGETIQLIANMTTPDGEYIIRFDEETVTSGNATVNDVEASFPVPTAPAGSHNIMIIDVGARENATTTFTVTTSHSLKVDVPEPPEQLQEGDNVTISVNIDGGESDKTYAANITVQNPKNVSYTKILNITTLEDGSSRVNITYPKDFPIEAETDYTGEYKALYNDTLGSDQFFIGLTKFTESHRFETVDIKATGYKPNENVTVNVTFEEKTVQPKQNVTATIGGLVHVNWSVPSNASMGIYTVSVTSLSNLTKKDPPDIQNFVVPGFAINITTRNLAKEPVLNVKVQVFENATLVVNATSPDSEKLVRLEIGFYTCRAYRKDVKDKDVKVGERPLNVTTDASFNFTCNLTNLKIFVEDKSGNRIPEAQLKLMQENKTVFEDTTDINGVTVAHSLLPNITYILNASRYDMHFDTTTIPELPMKDWHPLQVICPTLTLHFSIRDAENRPIHNATVKAQELMGGLLYEGNTVDGNVTLYCVFGKYQVKVYAKGIKLNETTIDLFENESLRINCKYYGLEVYVKVVDYFGQPIPNANVTLRREGLPLSSSRTAHNGVATFSDFIGGRVQIAVYLDDKTQPCVETTSSILFSATIEIKIGKYVLMAGILVETSQLATASIIAAAIILILLIEVNRRKRSKPQKSPS